VEAFLVLEGV